MCTVDPANPRTPTLNKASKDHKPDSGALARNCLMKPPLEQNAGNSNIRLKVTLQNKQSLRFRDTPKPPSSGRSLKSKSSKTPCLKKIPLTEEDPYPKP